MKLKMPVKQKLKKINTLSLFESNMVFGGQITKGDPRVTSEEPEVLPPPPPPVEAASTETKTAP